MVAIFGLWALVLLAWVSLLYQPSLAGPYHFDDLDNVFNVFNNPAIESFPADLQWHRAQSRPVLLWTFALDRALQASSSLACGVASSEQIREWTPSLETAG